jgi:hypothetical protein
MLSHITNYRTICRRRKRKLRQVAKFSRLGAPSLLNSQLLLLGSLKKSFAPMLAQADVCNRRQNLEAASPLPARCWGAIPKPLKLSGGPFTGRNETEKLAGKRVASIAQTDRRSDHSDMDVIRLSRP